MNHRPTEPHLAIRQALAQAILNSRAAITDLTLIRSAERLVLSHSAKSHEK
ncbi:MAG: hypothetical protein ACPGFA_01610 [Pikeienuella sp.]